MKNNNQKPSPEAKALSLFLMSHKNKRPVYKEQLKRINRQWEQVKLGEFSKEEYLEEVEFMLTSYGGYTAVIEKTVRHYIETSGEWKLKGDDQYCLDAQKIADEIMKK